MRADDVAGEISVIDQGPASAAVSADGDVEITLLSHGYVQDSSSLVTLARHTLRTALWRS